MSTHVREKLSDYLDGGLEPAVEERVRRHLRRCPTCRTTLSELKEVVDRASDLVDRPPERDLWPAIASRIAARPSFDEAGRPPGARPAGESGRGEPGDEADPASGSVWGRRLAVPARTLAAAAVLLLAVSLGAGWVLGRASGGAGATGGSGVAAPGPGTLPAGPVSARAAMVERGYAKSIAELEAELARRRDRLSPATLEALGRSLAAIDTAIAEAHRALARDSGDSELPRYLSRTYRRKMEVLKVALELSGGE